MDYDFVLLTDPRYLHAKPGDSYTDEVILEDALVQKELETLGFTVTRVSWDAPQFDWSSARYAIFRAVWDYFDRYAEFQTWFVKTAERTQFINSKALIDWNIDKHYLLDLKEKDIHIPRTLFIEAGSSFNLQEAIKEARKTIGFEGTDFVLKPCVAGGAWHTYKINETDWLEYDPVFRQLIAKEAMMLQEFQHHIVSEGEVSLMFMGDTFTHAILKKAKKGDFRVQNDYGGTVELYQPSEAEISFAKRTVMASPDLPLYARVDIFKDNQQRIALAELEIFEPELWFRHHHAAAQTLAIQLQKRLFP